jgi:methionyl aminopeptidase
MLVHTHVRSFSFFLSFLFLCCHFVWFRRDAYLLLLLLLLLLLPVVHMNGNTQHFLCFFFVVVFVVMEIAPLNYHGFPKSCCTSVNEVICHGIPDDRKLMEGDVVNVDITVYLDGYHGDCSEMFVAGQPDPQAKALLQATYDCWIKACMFVQPGRDYKELGAIMEDHISPLGFDSVRNFCGHGIGSVFHTTPNILHYRNNEPNGQMATGHTFTIEPMICEGSAKVLNWPDDWTATSKYNYILFLFHNTLFVFRE